MIKNEQEKKYLGRGHELKQLIGEYNSQGGRNQDVVVVEPCPGRAPFSGGPALRASVRRELMSHDQSVRRGSSPPLCLRKKDQCCLLGRPGQFSAYLLSSH